MKPILYSYFRSSCSYRVRIALNLKNISYEYRPVHLLQNGGQQHQENYRTLNPMGQVPLFVDNKFAVSQSMAIMEYLELKFPDYKIFPSDSLDRVTAIELCELINTGIQPLQNLSVIQKIKQDYCNEERVNKEWTVYWIEKGLSAFEKKINRSAREYCLGKRPGVVDCFLIPQVFTALRFEMNLNQYPLIKTVYKNCMQMEAFQKAAPENQPDAQ